MRLLAITPPAAIAPVIDVGLVELWLAAGAGALGLAVLLREPGAGPDETLGQPRLSALRAALAELGVPTLVSVSARLDPKTVAPLLLRDPSLAGVQLRGDPSADQCARWRAVLGPTAVIGRSVHGLEPSDPAGLDYTCLAPIHAPQTMLPGGDKRAIGLTGLRRWTTVRRDVIALGGVTPANARACIDAGARGVAGIRLFFGPRDEARQDVARLCRALSGTHGDHVQA